MLAFGLSNGTLEVYGLSMVHGSLSKSRTYVGIRVRK
jgi:hypothetical protein